MKIRNKIIIGTIFGGATVLTMHLINSFIGRKSLKNDNSSSSSRFFEWNSWKIKYEVKGSGEPILLLHNLQVTNSSNVWDKTIDTIAKYKKVYSIDLLGCGESDKPNIQYSAYLYQKLIADFIKSVIKSETDVIAIGLSSPIVINLCQDTKDIIKNVVLVNPPSIKNISVFKRKWLSIAGLVIYIPILGKLIYNIIHRKALIAKHINKTTYSLTPDEINYLTGIYYNNSHICNSRSKFLYTCILDNNIASPLPINLEGITNSIYILTGKESEKANRIAAEYIRLLPSIEHLQINNSKGLPHIENPNDFLLNLNYVLSELE